MNPRDRLFAFYIAEGGMFIQRFRRQSLAWSRNFKAYQQNSGGHQKNKQRIGILSQLSDKRLAHALSNLSQAPEGFARTVFETLCIARRLHLLVVCQHLNAIPKCFCSTTIAKAICSISKFSVCSILRIKITFARMRQCIGTGWFT